MLVARMCEDPTRLSLRRSSTILTLLERSIQMLPAISSLASNRGWDARTRALASQAPGAWQGGQGCAPLGPRATGTAGILPALSAPALGGETPPLRRVRVPRTTRQSLTT